jgi:RNA polymerase sigma factor (sigma-70 family)
MARVSNEELVDRIKAGEKELILDLWQKVRKLVIKIILRRYLPEDGCTNRVELDDLIQAGFIGMIGAIRDFDSSRGFRFTTYLGKHLANAAREALGIRTQKRDPLIDAISIDQSISSGQDDEISIIDALPDMTQQYVYDDLIDELAGKEDINTIFTQIKQLEPIEKEFLIEKYFNGRTFKEIGETHGTCYQDVRKKISDSLRKIRRSDVGQKIAGERYMDRNTNFYARKGLDSFNTSFSSVVEDIVERRERLRKSYRKEA